MSGTGLVGRIDRIFSAKSLIVQTSKAIRDYVTLYGYCPVDRQHTTEASDLNIQ
jgi:hypothetical protein